MSRFFDIKEELWLDTILKYLPPKVHELNRKAFATGRGKFIKPERDWIEKAKPGCLRLRLLFFGLFFLILIDSSLAKDRSIYIFLHRSPVWPSLASRNGFRWHQSDLHPDAGHPADLALDHLLYLGNLLRAGIVSFLPRLYIHMELV